MHVMLRVCWVCGLERGVEEVRAKPARPGVGYGERCTGTDRTGIPASVSGDFRNDMLAERNREDGRPT